MFENEDPSPFFKNWFIPWYANAAIWAVTVSVIGLYRAIQNPVLLKGPLPDAENTFLLQLVDYKTVLLPLGIAVALGLISLLLCFFPRHRKPKGRNAPKHLARRFWDEFESFALNASSISLITSYYVRSNRLFMVAAGCGVIWYFLHKCSLNRKPI